MQKELDSYSEVLRNFLNSHGLGHLFTGLVDHVAVKLKDTQDYEDFINKTLSLAESAVSADMGTRRIATLKLMEPLHVRGLGDCFYLEVMEPKPEKVGKDFVGLEHIEIIVGDCKRVQSELIAKGLECRLVDNGYHVAVELKLGAGLEVKFTNTKLADIVEKERQHGKITVLK